MSWRILTASAWADLENLTDDERAAVASDLLAWVDPGPPRSNRREVRGVEMFDDRLPSGFEVVYVVDEVVPYAALLRIRRTKPPGAGPLSW
ncbi:MAG: hypothetical protein M3083_07375 [Actinomycetota bacterium]|nr:hypothetical protein [Actinomycetota bacterium]MDQ6945794.1 hypothetical protein [Actinomycetota bacterium]